MKKWPIVIALILAAAGCTFRLDFLGEDRMKEVVLLQSPAKEKILDIPLPVEYPVLRKRADHPEA